MNTYKYITYETYDQALGRYLSRNPVTETVSKPYETKYTRQDGSKVIKWTVWVKEWGCE